MSIKDAYTKENQKKMKPKIKENGLYRLIINPEKGLEVDMISLVDTPAIEENLIYFSSQDNPVEIKMTIDKEQQMILTPVLIPNKIIDRNTDPINLSGIKYQVLFTKEDIEAIVENFMEKGYLKNWNLFHNKDFKTNAISIINSFISNEELGISNPKAFANLPVGTWFVQAKINNPIIWDLIKSGDLKGVSIEGLFNMLEVDNSNDEKEVFEKLSESYKLIIGQVIEVHQKLDEIDPTHPLVSKPINKWNYEDYINASKIIE